MNLLDKITAQLPFGNKSDTPEYFFALNIGLSEVTAAVWGIFGRQIDILGQATIVYTDSEDLIEKAFQALDKSLGALEVEPQKILFGVPEAWSVGDELKEPYLKLLQKMLKEYDLSAVAYVTTTNAITFLLQKQEGAPPTAILLGIGDFVEATLVRGGKVIGTKLAKRGDLFADIEETLKQFTEVEVLPSKILLYPTKEGEDMEKIHDELMSCPWMQRLSFLHFPKIEMLEKNVTLESIVASAASELNPQVDLKHSFHTRQQALDTPTGGQRQLNQAKPLPGGNKDTGFVRGDIKEHKSRQDIEVSPVEDARGDQSASKKRKFTRLSLSEKETFEDDNLAAPNLPDLDEPFEAGRELERTDVRRRDLQSGILFGSVLSLVRRATSMLSVTGLSGVRVKKPTGLVFVPIALFALILVYLLLPKSEVTVFVEPRVLEKETEVVADPKASSVDEAKQIIPGTVVETTVSGSGKSTATGTKQIGDPARGKVIVYNLTSAKVSFSQGTALTSGSSLKFTLDSSVQVASQSSSVGADFTTVIKPGKSDPVRVTAAAIGPEGNLAAGTELSVAGYGKSQVVARVEEALSGGTSKDVTVVTADDQKKLQAKVVDELRQKAEEELRNKETSGKKIISEALVAADGKYNFNKQVGDQAGEFTLSASVRFKGTAYSDADLKTIVSKLVGTDLPDGFQMNLQDMETQADVSKVEKDGRLIFKAKLRAKLLPRFDLESLKGKIRGRGVEEAVNELKRLENVVGGEVKFSPVLPGPLARVSLLDRNISINIAPK